MKLTARYPITSSWHSRCPPPACTLHAQSAAGRRSGQPVTDETKARKAGESIASRTARVAFSLPEAAASSASRLAKSPV